MRVLLVSRQHHPSHGGIGTYVHQICAAARHAGWHVELLTRPGTQWPPCSRVHEISTRDDAPEFTSRIADLRKRELIRPYRYALWSVGVARKLIEISDSIGARRASSFDVIEFVDSQAEGYAALNSHHVRERFADTKCIVHAHTPMWIEESVNGDDPSRFGRAIYHRWEKKALGAADGVVTTSRRLADRLDPLVSAKVIPYPIDASDSVSLGERAQRIVLAGSVQPRKGVDMWAQSLNEVLRSRQRATAVLIGPDTSTAPDGLSMAAHVQKQIDPRVIGRFRWLGSLAHSEVRRCIAESAAVVVPSRLESFSFVAAESILLGTRVIVSDHTGIAEHVPSLQSVPCDDVHAWAASQIQAVDDCQARSESDARCRAELLARCDPRRILKERESWLEEIQPRVPEAGSNGLAEMESFIEAVDSGADASSAMSYMAQTATSRGAI